MAYERDFKGIWIPKEVWLSDALTMQEKLFYVEIDSLDNDNGCFASNGHFADFFDVSKGICTQIIKSLESKKVITINLEYKGKQVVRRLIRVVNKLNTPLSFPKHPYLENAEGNNTSLNNTTNNTVIVEMPHYDEIIDHLNKITKSSYKATSAKTKSLINARINEGFKVEDFFQVHINKYAEWHNDNKMVKFLRPETLYGNKFEGYLNQKVSDNEKSRMIQDHTGISPLQRLREQGFAQ